ncbi:hypothetical protein BP6252_13012 [Coleophoma cylindrospora]|uniref:Uncharacterized protein n=1 Tax=Coleophoma cylindrospora TaxID=1849047 RepID=A0A3D8QDL9_9HELO|nr:hypothetical protein BP6252_13012 [Coleophoma cylindrospora]
MAAPSAAHNHRSSKTATRPAAAAHKPSGKSDAQTTGRAETALHGSPTLSHAIRSQDEDQQRSYPIRDLFRMLRHALPYEIPINARVLLQSDQSFDFMVQMTFQGPAERVNSLDQLRGIVRLPAIFHPRHKGIELQQAREKSLVLGMVAAHDAFLLTLLFQQGEIHRLFGEMVGMQHARPGVAEEHEVRDVLGVLDVRGLQVDAVQAPENDVVHQRHLGGILAGFGFGGSLWLMITIAVVWR